MDRLMHRIGLHGKSFIPLIMGFGCNVPAIMAARSIESRSSKIITVLITPFMSCSARLPVYVLLTYTFFPGHAAWVFLGMYVLGAVVAMLTARLLRQFWFKEDETPFVMELPPYRVPTVKTSMRHMWWKAKQYLQKMGGIILFASVIVWALNYFPMKTDEHPDRDSYLEMMGKAVNPVLERSDSVGAAQWPQWPAFPPKRLWYPPSECFTPAPTRPPTQPSPSVSPP